MHEQAGSRPLAQVPSMLLQIGEPLRLSLRLLLPQNGDSVLLKKKGEVLNLEDTLKLKSMPRDRLVAPAAEIAAAERELASELSSQLSGASPEAKVEPPARQWARGVIQGSLARTQDTSAVLDEVAHIVAQAVSQLQLGPARKAFDELIAQCSAGSTPLAQHNRRVGALATLIMLSMESVCQQEVSDTAFAGLMHDACLGELPEFFLSMHLNGRDLPGKALKMVYSENEAVGYLRHIDLVLRMIERSGVPCSEGTRKAILQHHENFDGSGLNNVPGRSIYRPARVIRVADDIACLLTSDSGIASVEEALLVLQKINRAGYPRPYDPKVIATLEEALRK